MKNKVALIGVFILLFMLNCFYLLFASNNDDYLHTNGNKIVNYNGREVWITGINWFGFEENEKCFHGLWTEDMMVILDLIADLGFNMIRVPIHGRLVLDWVNGIYPPPQTITQEPGINDYLQGLNSLEILDYAIDYCGQIGIKIMFDMHSIDPHGYMNEGVWYLPDFSIEDFITCWKFLTEHYKDNDTVIAMDLTNEPHDSSSGDSAKWDDSTDLNNFKYAAERIGNAIHSINPNLLIMVEGIQSFYDPDTENICNKLGVPLPAGADPYIHNTWWGGNLMGAKNYPVNLSTANKIVYSPHDYGPTVHMQPWFQTDFNYETMLMVWRQYWFYLYEETAAPLLIGEWGGSLSQTDNAKWFRLLRDHIVDYKIHHTFWCLNPNSGDTGGIFSNSQWDNINTEKYNLVKAALWQKNGQFVGLDHIIKLGTNGINVPIYYGDPLTTPAPGETPLPTQDNSPHLTLYYKCNETSPEASQIRIHLDIKNSGLPDIALSDVTVRYYYTKEGTAEEEFNVDHAVIGNSNIIGSFADGYLEIGFTSSAGDILRARKTGEIQVRIQKIDWSNYYQSDDYSFDPTIIDYTVYEKITVYHQGELLWGIPPSGPTPTPTPAAIITPYSLPGDVNEDGTVNIIDALLISQYYVGLNPDGFNPDNGDVNCDLQINIVDALLVAQYYVGLIENLICN